MRFALALAILLPVYGVAAPSKASQKPLTLARASSDSLARYMVGLDQAPAPAQPPVKARPGTPNPPPELGPPRRILINIPSGRLRFYDAGKLTLDIPMAIGRRYYPGVTGNSRTRIGSYRITSWHQDYRSRDYPTPWSKDPWRGAFGAFTAKLGPRASYQYIHGTVGPVELGDWLVEKREPGEVPPAQAALVERGLSHGCVRVANTNIAKLRKLAPLGTTVEKFYCLVERVPLADGGATLVTSPNVYRYKDLAEEAVFDVATGRISDYHHPKDAVGPRGSW